MLALSRDDYNLVLCYVINMENFPRSINSPYDAKDWVNVVDRKPKIRIILTLKMTLRQDPKRTPDQQQHQINTMSFLKNGLISTNPYS